MSSARGLTTTSYAILGLLAVRPWSTYELTRQMDRSLGRFWPRAESKLYEEPKKLAAQGLAPSPESVAACSPCNLRKGDRLPAEVEMWPRQAPFAPSLSDLHRNGRLFPPNYLHDSWLDYLYWDTELEP